MRKVLILTSFSLASVVLGATALAWTPTLDAATAKRIIDSAYGRADEVATFQTLDLTVAEGKFKAGDVVKAIDGGPQCVSNWLKAPTDFSKGSYPKTITLTGQADDVFLAATEARNQFKSPPKPEDLIKAQTLPNGQLRVYLTMTGLKEEKLRNAYTVAIRNAKGEPTLPAKKILVTDWQKAANNLWEGSMLYQFDVSKAGVDPRGKLSILIRNESEDNCAYEVTADLSQFL